MKRPKMATRVVEQELAIAFIQNMRWFVGMGPISFKSIENSTKVVLTAPIHAMSNFVW